jgi:hypothetical protein
MVRLGQTMHLSFIDTNIVSTERSEIPHDPRHLGVPSGASNTISEPIVRSKPTEHLSCIKISTVSKLTILSLKARDRGAPLDASKMIFEPMVCLTQTMHLYCTDTNIVSKRKEARFHMTHITLEFHQVHPKWLLSLWYVRRKPWTYLASNYVCLETGWAFTWASSPRSDFGADGTFGANYAPILHQH